MTLVCHMILLDNMSKGWSNNMGGNPVMTSHELAKFDVHRGSGSRVAIISDCHVVSQDQVNQGSCNFMGSSPSR